MACLSVNRSQYKITCHQVLHGASCIVSVGKVGPEGSRGRTFESCRPGYKIGTREARMSYYPSLSFVRCYQTLDC